MSEQMRMRISAYGRSVQVTAPTEAVFDDLEALLPDWFESERITSTEGETTLPTVGEVTPQGADSAHEGEARSSPTAQADGDVRNYLVVEEPGHLLRVTVTEALHPYLGRSLHWPLAIESLRSDLETWIAARAEGLVFVHAGVVAVDGRAVVLPGRSHSGKTTLTAELVRRGATYMSDEYAVVDEQGMVHAYPRRLSLRGPGADPGGFRRMAAAEIGGVTAETAMPLGLVLSLTYDPEVTGLDIEPASRGEAVLLMMHDCVCGQLRPIDAMNALTIAAASARAGRGRRGEVDKAADAVLAMAREITDPPPTKPAARAPGTDAASQTEPVESGTA